MRIIQAVIFAGLFTLALLTAACAEDYAIAWYSVNSGGGDTSGGIYKLNVCLGQPVAGFASSSDFFLWTGFWSGDVPTPQVVSSINAAKTLADGTFISISGNIATSAGGDFSNCFYIESANKISGIRVAAAPDGIASLVRGSVVNVFGVLGTTSDGERQLVGPIVIVVGSNQPLNPLGMTNGSLGGGDLGILPSGQFGVTDALGNPCSGINTIGLLVKTWGRVTGSGAGYVLIDDGSNAPVRVDTSTLATIPAAPQYVTVIGISGLQQSGNARFKSVMPRGQSDVN